MYTVPDQFNSAAGIETLASLASATFAGMERLAALNLNAARTLMQQGADASRALLSLQGTLANTDSETAADYVRRVCEIANQTREVLSNAVELPAGSDLALNALRSARAAANSAYDSINKAARQAGELAEANLAVATKFALMQGNKAA